MFKFVLVSLSSFIFTLSTFASEDVSSGVATAYEDLITIRTESYPRLPYSSATYYIYEKGGSIICTKMQVCNKYGYCDVSYFKGPQKDAFDTEPFDETEAVVIDRQKLKKHKCLQKFKLI